MLDEERHAAVQLLQVVLQVRGCHLNEGHMVYPPRGHKDTRTLKGLRSPESRTHVTSYLLGHPSISVIWARVEEAGLSYNGTTWLSTPHDRTVEIDEHEEEEGTYAFGILGVFSASWQ